MDIEVMRKEFESYLTMDGKFPLACERSESGDYRIGTTRVHWATWQASRQSIIVELPSENPLGSGPGDHGDGRPSFEQHCAAECNFIIRDCRDAIHAAGIRTK